ncbi:AAA domain-containing protein [Actinomycetes bacterium M1A6_2h]
MVSQNDEEVRGRVRRLLEFLRETVSSQSKPVRAYGPATRLEWLYRADRPVEVNETAAPGDVAVRVTRVSVDSPPVVPKTIAGQLDGRTDRAATPPTLNPKSTSAERAEFARWLTDWTTWAEEDRKRRPLAELYLSVDRMREESLAQPETVEVVLASGLLSATVADQSVDSHLLTQPVQIIRDDATGDLLVTPTSGSSPRLEDRQLLLGLDGLNRKVSADLGRKLSDTASTPLSHEASRVLSEWSQSAFRGASYVRDHTVPPARRRGTLRESPALLLRRRTGFALMSYYDSMISSLDAGVDVPLGLKQLVESIDSTDHLEWLKREDAEPTVEPLFPLPANRAQASIMDKLALDTGVVVEGPPGTGKTHTIANLVSALLAQGQRVLVTSEKSQALRVLRDKLPEELQDLCVSVTDLARGGSEELDRSVSVIATRLDDFDLAIADKTVKELSGKRFAALNRRFLLQEKVTSSRGVEAREQNFGADYVGTLSAVLSTLDARADRLAWVPGPVYSERPPITSEQFAELATLLIRCERHGADHRDHTLPDLAQILPNRSVIGRLCARARRRADDTDLTEVPTESLRRIAAQCRQILTRADHLDPAVRRALDGVLSGALGYHWTRAQNVQDILSTAVAADALVGSADVRVDTISRTVLSTFDAAARLYTEGRFDTLRWLRTPKEQIAVDDLGVAATVDGEQARGVDTYRIVAEHVRAMLAIDEASALLAEIGIQVTAESDRTARINAVDSVWRRLGEVRDLLARVSAIGGEVGSRFVLSSVEDVSALYEAISAALAGAVARDSITELTVIANNFDAATGGADSPEALALSDALRTADGKAFEDGLSAYQSAGVEQHEQRALDDLLRDLDASAPTLGHLLVEDRATDWVAVAGGFEDAWSWRWAHQLVTQNLSRPSDPNLDDDYDHVDAEIAQLTASLAAETAWRECLKHVTSREIQALHTYQESVSKIGAGHGKLAQLYRASARTAMQDAQSAVPAWIMPISQVLASIPPEQNAFDVVIVDEASQAQLSSLFLMWLAPRVIVVGDDKQCAPDVVPQLNNDRWLERLDTYLGDLPMHVRSNFTPRSSLFSLLRSRYNHRVRLREHFRSMPEIIEWSSKQFYQDTPLVPVRQFGAERLQPLRSTLVAGAQTEGSSATLVNTDEARQLVQQLCDCIADPDYEDMTFGVIVLQSNAQAELIRSMIAERIPAEQRDELRLRVGTPPEFQGDERDVVFVSMVIGSQSATNALTKEMWQRRFNVAASRARNQLWLMHSVPASDLSPTDLRASLLSYVEAAPTVPVPAMPAVVELGVLHSDFASMTAQRVFVALRDRGYHVNSSIEINELKLDLVVTGADAKLAVECDDERVWSSDEIKRRLDREIELRRCGWSFARVRASDFAADQERALSPVVEILDALGVLPGEVHIDLDATDSRWRPLVLTLDDPDQSDEEVTAAADVSTVPAPVIDAVVTPLPEAIVEHPVRPSAAPSIELEPGEPRPPTLDGSREIRVDSRYGSGRRAVPTSNTPLPTRTRARITPAAMPKRVQSVRKPSVSVASASPGVGIETLPAETQADLAALPAATMATGRVIAVAAARSGSPLTVRRCSLVTGMAPVDAEQLLADLELTRKLVRRQRVDGIAEWVRPEDVAS